MTARHRPRRRINKKAMWSSYLMPFPITSLMTSISIGGGLHRFSFRCRWETNCWIGPDKRTLSTLPKAVGDALDSESIGYQNPWSPRLHLFFIDQGSQSVDNDCSYCRSLQPFTISRSYLSTTARDYFLGPQSGDVTGVWGSPWAW